MLAEKCQQNVFITLFSALSPSPSPSPSLSLSLSPSLSLSLQAGDGGRGLLLGERAGSALSGASGLKHA